MRLWLKANSSRQKLPLGPGSSPSSMISMRLTGPAGRDQRPHCIEFRRSKGISCSLLKFQRSKWENLPPISPDHSRTHTDSQSPLACSLTDNDFDVTVPRGSSWVALDSCVWYAPCNTIRFNLKGTSTAHFDVACCGVTLINWRVAPTQKIHLSLLRRDGMEGEHEFFGQLSLWQEFRDVWRKPSWHLLRRDFGLG
jgi:hypothetical protein